MRRRVFLEQSAGDEERRMEAVIIATIGMLLYIWLRFQNIRFAGSSVLA